MSGKPWRATCLRRAIADAPDALRSPAVEQALAQMVSSCLHSSPGSQSPRAPVALKDFSVEAIAFLSDGVDTVDQFIKNKKPAELKGRTGLLLLGLRDSLSDKLQLVQVGVAKGCNVRSRADDTIALCVAYRAAELLRPEWQATGYSWPVKIVAADPMCGVGTYLLALRWVLQHRVLDGKLGARCPNINIDLMGSDSEESSILQAQDNTVPPDESIADHISLMFSNESTSEWASRMEAAGGLDLIVVDPPWGHRHSNYSKVMKGMHLWVKDWARALKPGGYALVVTIRTKQFECSVLNPDHGSARKLLVLQDVVQFDNKGHAQCKLYVLRKPTN